MRLPLSGVLPVIEMEDGSIAMRKGRGDCGINYVRREGRNRECGLVTGLSNPLVSDSFHMVLTSQTTWDGVIYRVFVGGPKCLCKILF